MEDDSYKLFCGLEEFIMIFMVLNFVLENYFKDILSLVDQSSDIGDKILDCWFLSFKFFFLWIIQIKQTFIAYDFGALHLCFYMLVCLDLCFMPSSMCLCAPCHACVPRPRLVCHAMCYYSHFVYFIAFSCHCPYNLAHIKGFGSPIFHVYT